MISAREILEAILRNLAVGSVVGFIVYTVTSIKRIPYKTAGIGKTRAFGAGNWIWERFLVGALIARLVWLTYKHPPPLS